MVQVIAFARLPKRLVVHGTGELYAEVPLKNAASDVEDNSRFIKLDGHSDDNVPRDGSSSNDECDELDPLSRGRID